MKAVVRDSEGCRMSADIVCDDEASLLSFARAVFDDYPQAQCVVAVAERLVVTRPAERVEEMP